MNRQWYVGVDFGLVRDHTAVAVLERTEKMVNGAVVARHSIPEIRRLDLGTLYPDVCKRVTSLVYQLPGSVMIAADATGVGRPIIDMLYAELAAEKKRMPALTMPNILSCVITGGVLGRGEGNVVHVPKREMILCFAGDLQTGVLTISSQCEHAPLLITEMRNFKLKVTAAGGETYEAWRENVHDDIVFAAALADWSATNYWSPIIDRPVKVTDKKVLGANGEPTTLTMAEAWGDHERYRRGRGRR